MSPSASALAKQRAYIAWAVLCVVWGTTYLAIKLALETIPPFMIGGIRYIIAGGALFAVLRAMGRPTPQRAEWGSAFVAGLLLLGIGNGGVIWAELWVPTGFAAILVACVTFWMVGTEALLPGGEPVTRRSLVGLLIGFAGIVMLVWPNLRLDGANASTFILGVVVLQFACFGWALGSSLSRRRKVKGDPVMFAAIQMLWGGVMMFVAGLFLGELPHLAFTPRSGAALAYLVVMGSLVGYVCYVYALTHLSPSFVSLYAYINPVVAMVLGTLILAEPFGWRIVFSIAIILAGMFIVTRKPAPPAARVEPSVTAPVKASAECEEEEVRQPA